MISGDSTGCKMTYSDPANASWAWNGVRVPALWNYLNVPLRKDIEAEIRVAPPDNHLGCNEYPPEYFKGRIALVKRGVCLFGLKALTTQRAGAILILVYDNNVGAAPIMLRGTDP